MSSESAATALRRLGAVSILVAGAIHLQQYHYDYYSVIPTIGPLFLLNFIGATFVGLALLAPGATARPQRRRPDPRPRGARRDRDRGAVDRVPRPQ